MKITEQKSFVMLPPAAHLCQICAVEHPEEQPHNAQSFYYQYWFALNNKCKPTWNDAMPHCSEEVKAPWLSGFRKCGIDIDSPNLTGNITGVQDLNQKLKP